MNIGIRLHDTAPGTLRERAAFARAQGFTCAQLALGKTLGAGYMRPCAATPGLASHIKREMGDLDIAVLGCYLNLANPDENAYADILAQYTAHLRLASYLGGCVVGTETGNPNAEYRYDPEKSHSEAALSLFIRRLRPVVESAEKLGAVLAIEPVYTHIVSDARRARRVLDAIASPCLQIILDPVNLLHKDNIGSAEEIIKEAIDLLCADTAVLHMKDYTLNAAGDVVSTAAGQGVMDYSQILRFVQERKPHIAMTLEDTLPGNAQAAREHLEKLVSA